MKTIYTAILVMTVFSLILMPTLANADGGWHRGGHGGWHGRGSFPSWGLGFGTGLFTGFLLAPRVYETPAPTCYQTIPGHWETRWDPYWHRYVNVYIPPYTTSYPCP